MKEFDYIAKYFKPLCDDVIGLQLLDDAACLTPPAGKDLVITTDTIVEGVHYLPKTSAGDVARKLCAVNLSDLAAKGAKPYGCFLNFAPAQLDEHDLIDFTQALGEQLKKYNFSLFGGDSVRTGKQSVFSLTLFGLVDHGAMVPRSGACAGDDIYVSGHIGAGGLGLVDAKAGRESAHAAHYLNPIPRLELGCALAPHINAAADISDGVLADLGHICRASKLTAAIDLSSIPLADPNQNRDAQLCAGDDYELVFTAAPQTASGINEIAKQAGVPITRIGQIIAPATKAQAGQVLDNKGQTIELQAKAWSHFG